MVLPEDQRRVETPHHRLGPQSMTTWHYSRIRDDWGQNKSDASHAGLHLTGTAHLHVLSISLASTLAPPPHLNPPLHPTPVRHRMRTTDAPRSLQHFHKFQNAVQTAPQRNTIPYHTSPHPLARLRNPHSALLVPGRLVHPAIPGPIRRRQPSHADRVQR